MFRWLAVPASAVQTVGQLGRRNREHARHKLTMPVLTVGATASFGAQLEPEIRPLAEHLHHSSSTDFWHFLPVDIYQAAGTDTASFRNIRQRRENDLVT